MRIRLAAVALATLVTGGVLTLSHGDEPRDSRATPELTSHSWSVQISTDFGTTWDSRPLIEGTTEVPLRVDTAALQARPVYQAFTLRTATGSLRGALVRPGSFRVSAGSADAAARIRIRAVAAPGGSCSATAFSAHNPLLPTGPADPGGAPGTPSSGRDVALQSATATTPGAPQTLCLEMAVAEEPSDGAGVDTTRGEPRDDVVTLVWPLSTRPAAD